MRDDCRGKETGRSCVGCIVDACVRGTFFFFCESCAAFQRERLVIYTLERRWCSGGRKQERIKKSCAPGRANVYGQQSLHEQQRERERVEGEADGVHPAFV